MEGEIVLRTLSTHLQDLSTRYGFTRLDISGSVARDQATETSDVDVIIEMPPDLFPLIGHKQNGRAVRPAVCWRGGNRAMRIASVADVKAKFSGYIEASKAGPVVVTKNGKPVAVLLAMQDEDELERLLMAYSPKLRQILDKAEQQIQAGQGISHDDFWREIEAEP